MDKILPVELARSILQEYEQISNTMYGLYTDLLDGKSNADAIQAVTHQLEQLKHRIGPAEAKLREHQRLHAELDTTTKHVQGVTVAILSLIQKLKQAEAQLESCLRSIDKKVEVVRRADQAPLDYDTLLSYAQRIAPYTAAAPDWNKQFQPYSKPPVPTEADIRKSMLMLITQGLKSDELYQQPMIESEKDKSEEKAMEPASMDQNAMAPTNMNTDHMLDLDL